MLTISIWEIIYLHYSQSWQGRVQSFTIQYYVQCEFYQIGRSSFHCCYAELKKKSFEYNVSFLIGCFKTLFPLITSYLLGDYSVPCCEFVNHAWDWFSNLNKATGTQFFNKYLNFKPLLLQIHFSLCFLSHFLLFSGIHVSFRTFVIVPYVTETVYFSAFFSFVYFF